MISSHPVNVIYDLIIYKVGRDECLDVNVIGNKIKVWLYYKIHKLQSIVIHDLLLSYSWYIDAWSSKKNMTKNHYLNTFIKYIFKFVSCVSCLKTVLFINLKL